MGDSEADLGSFFEEINQITAVAAAEGETSQPTPTPVGPVPATQVHIGQPKQVVHSAPALISKAAVISKPAEIRSIVPEPSTEVSVINNSSTSQDQQAGVMPHHMQQHQHQSYNTSSYNSSSNVSGHMGAPPLPPAPAGVAPPQVPRQSKVFVRKAAEETWVDETLQEWPENDFRIFVGDLAKEVTTELLANAFQHYHSFAKAKVIRKKADNKTRGFGFVSFLDPMECAKAIREQQGKYLLSRPMKIRKSTWKDKDALQVRKKENKRRKLEESLGLV